LTTVQTVETEGKAGWKLGVHDLNRREYFSDHIFKTIKWSEKETI